MQLLATETVLKQAEMIAGEMNYWGFLHEIKTLFKSQQYINQKINTLGSKNKYKHYKK
jgi:hypothetical protein